jgi:hypothetical protein
MSTQVSNNVGNTSRASEDKAHSDIENDNSNSNIHVNARDNCTSTCAVCCCGDLRGGRPGLMSTVTQLHGVVDRRERPMLAACMDSVIINVPKGARKRCYDGKILLTWN